MKFLYTNTKYQFIQIPTIIHFLTKPLNPPLPSHAIPRGCKMIGPNSKHLREQETETGSQNRIQ